MENPFLSYTDRSYNQIKQAVLTRLPIYAPEITDLNESNPLIRLVSILASVGEMLGYYLDFQAREGFAPYARLWQSAIRHAHSYDYSVAPPQPATVQLLFTFQGDGSAFAGTTIPAGTVVQTTGGIQFRTIQTVVVPASSLNTIPVAIDAIQQGASVTTALGTSDGTASQVFVLPATAGAVVVFVSSVAWELVESFAYSIPGDQHVIQTANVQGQSIIQFGDGIAGGIPALGAAIDVSYFPTLGATGNVESNTLTQIVTPFTVPAGFTVSVTNQSRAVGGTGVEGLQSLQKRIPAFLRTQKNAIKRKDYTDVALLNPRVEQAAVQYNCGKYVELYITPVGGGIATDALVASVQAFIDLRRAITTKVTVKPAGQVQMQIQAIIRVRANYRQSDTLTAVRNALIAAYDSARQTIGGTIHLSDAYQAIETTEGVESSTITAFVPRPYARRLAGTNTLVWTVALQPSSTASHYWRIIFTSATAFQLLKDNNFQGSFSVGAPIALPEVIFTIAGTYSTGDQFEFYTYPFAATDIDLLEMSIPVVLSADVALVGIGGIV